LAPVSADIKTLITSLSTEIGRMKGEDGTVSECVGKMQQVLKNVEGSEAINDLIQRVSKAEKNLSAARGKEVKHAIALAGKARMKENLEIEAFLLETMSNKSDDFMKEATEAWERKIRQSRAMDEAAANTVNEISATYKFMGIPIFNYGKDTNDGDVAEERARKFRMMAEMANNDVTTLRSDSNQLRSDANNKRTETAELAEVVRQRIIDLTTLLHETFQCKVAVDQLREEQRLLEVKYSGASLAMIGQFSDVVQKATSMYGDYSAQEGGALGEYKNFLECLDVKIHLVVYTNFWLSGTGMFGKIHKFMVPKMSMLVPATVPDVYKCCNKLTAILDKAEVPEQQSNATPPLISELAS